MIVNIYIAGKHMYSIIYILGGKEGTAEFAGLTPLMQILQFPVWHIHAELVIVVKKYANELNSIENIVITGEV